MEMEKGKSGCKESHEPGSEIVAKKKKKKKRFHKGVSNRGKCRERQNLIRTKKSPLDLATKTLGDLGWKQFPWRVGAELGLQRFED